MKVFSRTAAGFGFSSRKAHAAAHDSAQVSGDHSGKLSAGGSNSLKVKNAHQVVLFA